MADPINDMFNQIKNAEALLKPDVSFPFSNLKYEIIKILMQEGFVGEAKKIDKRENKIIKISLKYKEGIPLISEIKRISKPGQRIYIKAAEIKPVRRGLGVAIISTPQGLMSNKEAKKKKLGGEIICEVW